MVPMTGVRAGNARIDHGALVVGAWVQFDGRRFAGPLVGLLALDLVTDVVDEPFSRGQPRVNTLIRPLRLYSPDWAPYASPRRTLARLGRVADSHDEEIRIVSGRLHRTVRRPPHDVAGSR